MAMERSALLIEAGDEDPEAAPAASRPARACSSARARGFAAAALGACLVIVLVPFVKSIRPANETSSGSSGYGLLDLVEVYKAAAGGDSVIVPAPVPPLPELVADDHDSKPEKAADDGSAAEDGKCKDAVKGSDCFGNVTWVREHGIYEHPAWYDNMDPKAPFKAFQMQLYKSGHGNCHRPCGHIPTSAPTSAPKSTPAAGTKPKPDTGPKAQSFYVYRAQSAAHYPLENINAADLAGVLWYLHNEVVTATPRKYKIDRIRRFMLTVKNTQEFWNTHKRQFGAFVAYDAGRCTTPVCEKIYHQYGFIVGCQTVDIKVAGYLGVNQTNWNCKAGDDQCKAPLWYSLPGPCPDMGMTNKHIAANKVDLDVNRDKTPECLRRMPGGHCDKATGAPDCTYSYVDAGEIFLDDLVGIDDYSEFWNTSYTKCMSDVKNHTRKGPCLHKKEYDPETDTGVGCSFWDGKNDKEKCAARMKAAEALFKKKYPDLPEQLEAPPCEFDMYYDGEFDWPVNHTGAHKSSWWDQRMKVKSDSR